MLQVFLHTAVDYLREFAEVAVLGFFVVGILNAVVNKAAIARHLGGGIVGANALAATWGFLMPLCCCAGIPTALTLYRSGSRRGPVCAFLIAVPWFNWYGLAALVIFLGWRAGVIVSMSAVTIGFVAGILIDTIVGRPPHVSMTPVLPLVAAGCTDAGCCDGATADPARRSLLDLSNPREKVGSGVRFAVDLLRRPARG
ncbi:MAG TPA: permease [bacterium]|nr:permease [bacterium]